MGAMPPYLQRNGGKCPHCPHSSSAYVQYTQHMHTTHAHTNTHTTHTNTQLGGIVQPELKVQQQINSLGPN